MSFQTQLWGLAAAIGLTGLAIATAQTSEALAINANKSFQPIEQSLPLKIGITIAGLGLIGLELWWFLFSSSQTPERKADD
ncbi:MAG: hypothetical protein ACPGVO_01440 [Spirulinaceae cyanobacterium]